MAIAFDAKSNGAAVATSVTVSHTCTGSNLILIAGVAINSGNDITTVTYNGTGMTQLATDSPRASGGGGQREYFFYLINPSTGTHDIVASHTASADIGVTAASYTGVKQTGFIDSQNGADLAGSPGATSFSISTTVVASNCWLVGLASGNRAPTAGAGTTLRDTAVPNMNCTIMDSNATVGTGSQTLAWTTGTNDIEGEIIVSLAPFVASATTPTRQLIMTGVGQ